MILVGAALWLSYWAQVRRDARLSVLALVLALAGGLLLAMSGVHP